VYRYAFPEQRSVPQTMDERIMQAFDAMGKAQRLCEELHSEGTALSETMMCLEVIESCEAILRSYPASVLQKASDLVVSRNRRKGLTRTREGS
jgi:hypothetical protein